MQYPNSRQNNNFMSIKFNDNQHDSFWLQNVIFQKVEVSKHLFLNNEIVNCNFTKYKVATRNSKYS